MLAAVVTRVREPGGGIPLVAAYDYNEKVWNPPMPLLLQWHFRLEDRPLGPGVIRRLLNDTLAGSGLTDAGGTPLRFTPTISGGCSSPMPSCTACRPTSPSWSPGTGT